MARATTHIPCARPQAERERKRLEVQERKQASKKLLEEEEAQLEERAGAERLTRAKIAEVQRREREAVEAAGACALQKGVTVEELDTDNPNHLLRRRQMEGEVDARTVDEAIVVLGISKDTPEMHPEKRMKAAYAVFEEQELPRLKEENPHLRMSQVKQLLRKEWMKSPENPVNKLL